MEIRTHNGGWAVWAQWYGAERPVYGGAETSIWKCLRWKQARENVADLFDRPIDRPA